MCQFFFSNFFRDYPSNQLWKAQTNCRLKITTNHNENTMFLMFLNWMIWNKNFFNNSSLPPSQQLSIERKKFVSTTLAWIRTHGIFRDLPWVFLSFFIIHSVPRQGFFLFFHKVPLVLSRGTLPNNKKGERLKLGWNRCLNAIFFHWILKDGGTEGRSLWKLALRGFLPLYVKDGFVR